MRTSAALLLHRLRGDRLQVLLVHPGGPFWAKKDEAAWSVPKGEYGPGEDVFGAAVREFTEELGLPVPDGDGPDLDLGEIKQSSKVVRCWARRADVPDEALLGVGDRSNTVEIAWPPRSGRTLTIPEVDRAEWFDLETARVKLVVGQRTLLDRLVTAAG